MVIVTCGCVCSLKRSTKQQKAYYFFHISSLKYRNDDSATPSSNRL